MESLDLRISDVNWGHEPFLQKLLIHNETIFRFMERTDLQLLDAHWDHEPFCSKSAPSEGDPVCGCRGTNAETPRSRDAKDQGASVTVSTLCASASPRLCVKIPDDAVG